MPTYMRAIHTISCTMSTIPGRLAAFQQQDIILAVGEHDPACENNREMSGILWGKGIGNALRIWDGWAHDWPYWEKMIRLYIGGHD